MGILGFSSAALEKAVDERRSITKTMLAVAIAKHTLFVEIAERFKDHESIGEVEKRKSQFEELFTATGNMKPKERSKPASAPTKSEQ